MELNVRNLTDEDYPTLVQWWKDWEWDPVPKDMLPDNGIGGVAKRVLNLQFVCGDFAVNSIEGDFTEDNSASLSV